MTNGGDAHILVVEDDDQVRAQVARQLTGLGYRVTVAADGRASLERFEKAADIDLVFTDVMMPGGIDGPELVDAILQRQPGINILFTSGYSEEAIRDVGRPGRPIPLLSTPYRLQKLAEQVARALHG